MPVSSTSTPRKLVLLEINEITWNLIDPFIERGLLPTFKRLKQAGAWGSPMSVDLPPQLDPWITWSTVYSGRPQKDHNVYFLQQPPESIRARRIWEILSDRGVSVGVYGSLCSWPPKPVKGFHVPDTFAQDAATYPESLRPIQQVNLTYTRSVRLPGDEETLATKLRMGSKLPGLGLRPSTVASIARQLWLEARHPEQRWQRVMLQPMINFDFFSALYRAHQPQFATFHTNHVAHYQHTYWKAMDPVTFRPLDTTDKEVQIYGRAIEYGYRSADALLARMLTLLDDRTVLVVASSMGQKPYHSDLKGGKSIAQLRSLDQLLEVIGASDRARALSTMSGQFNIYPADEAARAFVIDALGKAYIDTPERPMFIFDAASVDNAINVDLRRYDGLTGHSRVTFPHNGKSFDYEDLVHDTGLVKSGCHDPKGMLIMYGAGIRSGATIGECTNLDLAPTMLALLGQSTPAEMTGRVLSEACTDASGWKTAIAG